MFSGCLSNGQFKNAIFIFLYAEDQMDYTEKLKSAIYTDLSIIKHSLY